MTADHSFTDRSARFHRQILLPGIGEAGQRALGEAHALLVGCGALGTVIAELLARAGIGEMTIVDRDVVELTNLQRQILFDERDVERGTPKAVAASEKIAQINRGVTVHAHADDFNATNAEQFARGADLILDGLDNFETRYLLNDLAVREGLPFIYGGAVGTTGMSFTVLPHRAKRAADVCGRTQRILWSDEQSTPCLRCVFPDPPPPGTTPTCDTAGVLSAAVMMVASHQVTQAIKLITGNVDALDRSMLSLDLWRNDVRRFDVGQARMHSECPCCVQGRFDFLEGSAASGTTSLCGRNAVQINPAATGAGNGGMDLQSLGARLAPHGAFTVNEMLLRGELTRERGRDGAAIELTVFANGRAIIKGTSEPEHARSIYAKYIGA